MSAQLTQALILEGAHVRLEPLTLGHLDGLCAVGLDSDLWRWDSIQKRSRQDMETYVQKALDEQKRGVSLPFATVFLVTGQVIGSTRYLNIDLANRRVEIGATWIAKPWQRTAVNSEAKYLMLRHAFEVLECFRVELKTDALNERSRRAILRLGAKEEGTLRRHMVTDTGRVRDTVYFSILDHEWPAVKARLQAKLNPRYMPAGTRA
ncbi:MAG TPA: GNAT family protein [Gammaproteobacteria bacterium]|nr:GNAT family protein [Gammaproteobacteria bacterium]